MKRLTFLSLALFALMAVASGEEHRLKIRLAVAPIDWSAAEAWKMPEGFQAGIYEKLVKKLVDTGRFTVLEREALNALLKEQAIKEANTGQPQHGKLVPAQALLQGKITDFEVAERGGGAGITVSGITLGGSSKQATVSINVRLFDVDTSEVLATETSTGKSSAGGLSVGLNIGSTYSDFNAFQSSPLGKATSTAIDRTVELVMKKMERQPWSCKVADFDASDKEVAINAGIEAGVRVGDRFEVDRVSKVIKDPDTGQIIGRRTHRVGSVIVSRVEKNITFCALADGDAPEVGDSVTEPAKP